MTDSKSQPAFKAGVRFIRKRTDDLVLLFVGICWEVFPVGTRQALAVPPGAWAVLAPGDSPTRPTVIRHHMSWMRMWTNVVYGGPPRLKLNRGPEVSAMIIAVSSGSVINRGQPLKGR